MRPPTEAASVLIEATRGCSHNKCTFCGTYRDTCFSVAPMEQIEADICEASQYYPHARRVFLLSGDAFVLSFRKLSQIADWVAENLPTVHHISMFASVPDIARKTDAELRTLAGKKVDFLYLGTESGSQDILDFVNKGYNVEEATHQIRRLEENGIHYFTSFITGIAGDDEERGLAHARATAEFLNGLHPDYAGSSSLSIFDNAEIDAMVRAGTFRTASEVQMLKETREMLSHLDTPTFFFGAHASNMVPVSGRLLEQKPQMLTVLDSAIEKLEHSGPNRRYDRDGRI